MWISHLSIYLSMLSPSLLDFLPIYFTTEHWVDFSVLYTRSLLVDFMHSISTVYMSTPVSWFIPPPPACRMCSWWCWSFLLIHSGESGDVCGAHSLGEMGACCMGSAEAAFLAIFSSFLRFCSLKGCVTVISAIRQVEWHLLTLRSSGPSCVTMWNRDVSGSRVCGCRDLWETP